MFYIQKENIVRFTDEDKTKLTNTLTFTPEYADCEVLEVPDGYVAIVGRELLTQEAYETELEQKERERLDRLSMTRGDVFEAMILAKGLGKAQLRAMIEQAELDELTKALYLNRFDEALDFFRGFPIFNMLGATLGITSDMLDKFFETKDYHYLTKCALTINATPESATVAVAPNPTPYGEVAHYKVECEGYLSQEGDIEMLQDTTLDVELVAIEEGGEV